MPQSFFHRGKRFQHVVLAPPGVKKLRGLRYTYVGVSLVLANVGRVALTGVGIGSVGRRRTVGRRVALWMDFEELSRSPGLCVQQVLRYVFLLCVVGRPTRLVLVVAPQRSSQDKIKDSHGLFLLCLGVGAAIISAQQAGALLLNAGQLGTPSGTLWVQTVGCSAGMSKSGSHLGEPLGLTGRSSLSSQATSPDNGPGPNQIRQVPSRKGVLRAES